MKNSFILSFNIEQFHTILSILFGLVIRCLTTNINSNKIKKKISILYSCLLFITHHVTTQPNLLFKQNLTDKSKFKNNFNILEFYLFKLFFNFLNIEFCVK